MIAIRPSLGHPGLGHDERIRDGGAAVVWQRDPTVPHARVYADRGEPRYRRASSCATPGLLGILEVPDVAVVVIANSGAPRFVGAGVWVLYQEAS